MGQEKKNIIILHSPLMTLPSPEMLKEFFLIFGAEQSLSEAEVEKLERVLHEIQPKSLASIRKLSKKIVEAGIEKPEDELVDLLKKNDL